MDTVKISKLIALVLRHKPETLGITLDSHGWASTKDLVEKINNQTKFTMKDLEEIVRDDDKQRYSFNSDKTKIRANQGHSIKVDVELERATPPDILYHGTATKYVGSIRASGILKRNRNHVHLSEKYETAVMVGERHGTPSVIIVDAKKMHDDGFTFYRSANGVWLTDYVPNKYIEV